MKTIYQLLTRWPKNRLSIRIVWVAWGRASEVSLFIGWPVTTTNVSKLYCTRRYFQYGNAISGNRRNVVRQLGYGWRLLGKAECDAQRTFANSPHLFVDKWDTPILCIHGEKDYRILANQGMAAFNAAVLRGVPAELLIYPDETIGC